MNKRRSPVFRKLAKAWPQPVRPEDAGGKGIVDNPDTQAHLSVNQDAVMEGRGTALPVKGLPKPAGSLVSGNKRAINAEAKYGPPAEGDRAWAMTPAATKRAETAHTQNRRLFDGVMTPAQENQIVARGGAPIGADRDPSGGWETGDVGNHAMYNDISYWAQTGAESHNSAFPIPSQDHPNGPHHFRWAEHHNSDGSKFRGIEGHIDNRGGGKNYGSLTALWQVNPQTGLAEVNHNWGGAGNNLDAATQHLNAYLTSLKGMHKSERRSPVMRRRLAKALPRGAKLDVANPGDQTENLANRQGFPGSPQHMVMEDAAGGPEDRGVQPVAPTHTSTTHLLQQVGKPGEKPGHNLVRWTAANDANRAADTQRGWNADTQEWFSDVAQEPARTSVRPNGSSRNLAVGHANQLNENDEFDRRNEMRFWSHPNFYEWHDAHTDHHNPKPWEKQDAIATARSLGLIKNDQAAGVGTPRYAEFATPYGKVQPGIKSNLLHYDYNNKLPDVADLVKRHGFKVYYAGGKHGKPDLANRNYNTGHLMIYDPTPASGGDFGEQNYTDAWRQTHELAHALTHPQVNQVYGEARRMGKLGIHRSLNDAMRAVHWEWLAAHKQRELNRQIGIHVPDETFHKELNTIMHDAVHRAVTGQFTEPSQEGFVPHSHKVPLEVAFDQLRNEGQRLGLGGHHELIRKHEPRPMVRFVKALPKTLAENAANQAAHAVFEDSVLEQGAKRDFQTNLPPSPLDQHFLHQPPEVQLAMRQARRANMVRDPYHAGKEPWNLAVVGRPSETPLWDNADKQADRDYWKLLDDDIKKVKSVARSPILKRKQNK